MVCSLIEPYTFLVWNWTETPQMGKNKKYDKKFNAITTKCEFITILDGREMKDLIKQPYPIAILINQLFQPVFISSIGIFTVLPLLCAFRRHSLRKISCLFARITSYAFVDANKDVSIFNFLVLLPFCNICIMKSHHISCLST